MGSATSHKASPAVRPEGEQKDWPVFVCQQGAFLFDPRAYFPVDPEEASVDCATGVPNDPARGRVALPPCRERDTLLKQPALGLRLSQDEAGKLIADTVGAAGVLAATDVGPIGQDKASNQDFALAATIRVAPKAPAYQFVAVADGVTTRTLWPERSARLAVFAAWRAARRHAEAERGFSHESFDRFRESLINELRTCLETDRTILLNADQVPDGWSEDTYRQFREREELWYNTTLHVVLVGPEAGFALSCGDGGFVVRKHENEESKAIVLVRSTDDVSVSGIVSLGPDSMRFRPTRIGLGPGTRLDIIVTTDGVDRSLRREAGNDSESFDPYGPEFLGSPISALVKDRLLFKSFVDAKLAQIPNREIDNVSTAILRWPPPDVLPTPPTPLYSGSIAASGEGVDEINGKMAARRKPPPTLAQPQPAPLVPDRLAGQDPRADNAPPSTRAIPANDRSKSKAPIRKDPAIWNSGMVLRDIHARPQRPDAASGAAWTIADVELAMKQVFALSGQMVYNLHPADRTQILITALSIVPQEKIDPTYMNIGLSMAAFCKVMFYLFSFRSSRKEFYSRAINDRQIESRLDQRIFDVTHNRPQFSRNEIKLMKSFTFAARLFAMLERHPATMHEMKHAVDAFRRL